MTVIRKSHANLIILVLVCIFRILSVLVFSNPFHPDAIGQYLPMAWNLYHGNSFSLALEAPYIPTAVRLPGYPLFLALFYCPWPQHPEITIFMQALLEVTAICLIFRCGVALTANPKTALLGAVLYALYPFSLQETGTMTRTSIFTCFLVAGIYIALRAFREKKLRTLSFAGFLLALATYFQEDGFYYFLILMGAWFMAERRNLKKAFKGSALLGAVFMLTLLPWTMRNALVFKKFIPLTNSSFSYLWLLGNVAFDSAGEFSLDNSATPGNKMLAPNIPVVQAISGTLRKPQLLPLLDPADSSTMNDVKEEFAFAWMTYATPEQMAAVNVKTAELTRKYLFAYPFTYPFLVAKRLIYYSFSSRADLFPLATDNIVARSAFILFHFLLISGGLLGIFLSRGNRWLIFFSVFPFISIAALGQPLHRYTFPVFPLFFLGWVLLVDSLQLGLSLAWNKLETASR